MDLQIKPAKKEDLELLNTFLPKKIVAFHADKIQEQERGKSLWLIAWLDNIPIGHVQLKLSGSEKMQVREYTQDTPEIDAFYIVPGQRDKGFGTEIVEYVEKLVKEKGYLKLGLSVDIKNLKASKLYEKLGFKYWPLGDFDNSWEYTNQEGVPHKENETCTYMIKQLD
jgi:GNAT superfamily N-acetyltransferase